MRGGVQATSEKLIRDVKTVVQDAEELIKATSGDFGDKTREARAKLAGALVVAKETCNRLENSAAEGLYKAQSVVRNHPVPTLGLALGLGIALGLLLSRER